MQPTTLLLLLMVLSLYTAIQSYVQCGEGQYFTRCVKDCPVGCDNLDNPPRCRKTGECRPGCMCREGYVRLISTDPNSPCVKYVDCGHQQSGNSGWNSGSPNQQNSFGGRAQGKCAPEETWTNCKSKCPVSCNNMHYPPRCNNAGCQPGCVCKPGYVRLDSNDPLAPCVTRNMCAAVENSDGGGGGGDFEDNRGNQGSWNHQNSQDVCPDGSMPAGTCEGGQRCRSGYTCDRGMCCRNLETDSNNSGSNGNPTFGSIIKEIAGTFLPNEGGGLFQPGQGIGGLFRPGGNLANNRGPPMQWPPPEYHDHYMY
uniref:TIL domain-containing protein n=1 Tax=Trichuris muris TaxID=70415 RepID=A0A5S6R0C1_TRIMR